MSQYNYYQYQTQAQQQQQPTAAAATGALTWNGREWVSSSSTTTQSMTAPAQAAAPPETPEPPPGMSIPPPNSTPQAFVAAYSTFYQEWKSRAAQQSQLAATLPPGPQRDEAERKAQWAEYYSDQSSRCAHYYNTNQDGQYGQYGTQAQPRQQPQPYQQHQQHQYSQAPAMASKQPGQPPPDAMKRYVHRCLAQCTTDDQKKRVQAAVELVISDKIRDGTLNQTDWDRLDLVTVGDPSRRSHQQQHQYYRGQQQQQTQYQSQPPEYKKQRSPGFSSASESGGGGGSNYYGPAESSFGEDQSDFIAFDLKKGGSSSPRKRSKGQYPNGGRKNKKKNAATSGVVDGSSYYAPQPSDGFERSNATLNARQARFAGRGGIGDAAYSTSTSKAGVANVERYMGKTVIGGSRKLREEDFEAMTVKGTCKILEKDYLRLTAPPKAELVRPASILKEHLSNLKKLWVQPQEQRGAKRDYLWFCSQFKAIRQDLTVQRIFNSFSIDTYETHARIALEQGDVNEFNQCQTQLAQLYEKISHDTSSEEKAKGLKNETEFIAYRILYYIFLAGNKKYEGGSSDMMKIMLTLSAEQRQHPIISHALKVRVAVADYDYHAFFKLQDICPNMGAYLLDYLIPNVRSSALQRIQKAFRPSIAVDYVLSELGFDIADADDAQEGKAWLISCGCKLSQDQKEFLTKDSVLQESDLVAKKSSLI